MVGTSTQLRLEPASVREKRLEKRPQRLTVTARQIKLIVIGQNTTAYRDWLAGKDWFAEGSWLPRFLVQPIVVGRNPLAFWLDGTDVYFTVCKTKHPRNWMWGAFLKLLCLLLPSITILSSIYIPPGRCLTSFP